MSKKADSLGATVAPGTSTPAASQPTASSSVPRLLRFAMEQERLRTIGELRSQFNRVVDKAKSKRHEIDWPTRAQFDRATAEADKNVLLRALLSRL